MTLILASEFSKSFHKFSVVLGDLAQKSVLVIDTAPKGEGGTINFESDVFPFQEAGAKVTVYDLAGKTKERVKKTINQTDIIYVCGGNSFYLLAHMQKCDFETLLKESLTRGLIYIGSSAGSVVCGPDINFISAMDDPKAAKLYDTRGLNLIDFSILPHWDHPTLSKAAKNIAKNYKFSHDPVILRDDQAFIIEDNTVSLV